MELSIIIPVFFVIAFLYSSVGHGGASGYLAVMVLMGFVPSSIKSTALIINLFVSGIAFFSFYKARYFKFNLLWPFIVTSIPAAYAGAQISINTSVFKVILSGCLLIAITRMLYKPENSGEIKKVPIVPALITGGIIGLFSGMIGIGGGIILSPLLIMLNWSTVKEAAAVSAPFIFLNSLSGLSGIIQQGFKIEPYIIVLILASILGSIPGSYFGSKKFSLTGLKYILAGILFFAAAKLIII